MRGNVLLTGGIALRFSANLLDAVARFPVPSRISILTSNEDCDSVSRVNRGLTASDVVSHRHDASAQPPFCNPLARQTSGRVAVYGHRASEPHLRAGRCNPSTHYFAHREVIEK